MCVESRDGSAICWCGFRWARGWLPAGASGVVVLELGAGQWLGSGLGLPGCRRRSSVCDWVLQSRIGGILGRLNLELVSSTLPVILGALSCLVISPFLLK